MRDTKGVTLDGRGRGEKPGGVHGGETVSKTRYEKNLFSIEKKERDKMNYI